MTFGLRRAKVLG